MRLQSAVLLATVSILTLAACGDDEPATPTGPVTLKFRTGVYTQIPGVDFDTVKGIVIVDNTDTLELPYDSLTDVPRGEHTFEAQLAIEYLSTTWTANIDPRGNTAVIDIPLAGSCRVFRVGVTIIDGPFCDPSDGPARNAIRWSGSNVFCPAGDFNEFCTPNPSADGLGLTWPVNVSGAVANEYVTQAKLLVAATVGPELAVAAEQRNIAMALYRVGDYSPRRRHQIVEGDSSRYTATAWTDVRHVPVYNFATGQLAPTDRPNGLFGLEVKATYLLPPAHRDVLVIRYDVTNISDEDDYRRVHPQVGPNGFTLQNIYLTPVLDVDVGGAAVNEADDDVATVFPAEQLAVAWDRTFAVSFWETPFNTAPGLVGLKVLSSTAGTPKGVVFATDTLDYLTRAREVDAYAILTAGRGATRSGCFDYPEAFVCSPELGDDVRIGYSVGPIAQLAPGQSTSLTVAILLARPEAGQFASGTAVPPAHATAADFASTTKASYRVAATLRALAAAIGGVTVTPAP
jgi:hypothetical protein